MVDFTKRLAKKAASRPLDPVELYDTLDRASDKGELRSVQRAVLEQWHANLREKAQLVVKLHTGQGKTLIGLLILQSKLNEGVGPALYLCPNNFLIEQTRLQARQFGIPTCVADPELPEDFKNSEAILVTSVQKLFNGLTKFGLGAKSMPVGTILLDDSHACVDAIRAAFCIRVDQEHTIYSRLITLFGDDLEHQGAGTFADIAEGQGNDLLPVPYWAWQEKVGEVTRILAKSQGTDEIKFVWPLLKDELRDCQCYISSRGLEISPYLAPLRKFGTYTRAKHRIFMSATVTDDSFLVRDLRLPAAAITRPLTVANEKWSGEKMILIPSLIDESLTRSKIVATFAPPKARPYGCVALTPSFAGTKDWAAYGARVASTEDINEEVDKLRQRSFGITLVFANRYDGIDLPDDTCRLLIFDSKPYGETYADRYAESCRVASEVTATRAARAIEQGLGRSVRGEKDYCAIVIVGDELVAAVRGRESRKLLSPQTRAQIEIGLEIAKLAQEELDPDTEPIDALQSLVNQCVKRDPGWKEFYIEQMGTVPQAPAPTNILEIFEKELDAEQAYQDGNLTAAVKILQELIDTRIHDEDDKGWYLQEMARYTHALGKTKSNELQIAAHRHNSLLMKPRDGMQIDKITPISHKRVERIKTWLSQCVDSKELSVRTNEILGSLAFGVDADRFEQSLNSLGKALGFECQRPDKQWGVGPDNLWGLQDGEFVLFECKNDVDLKRAEINKRETGQLNNSVAWFQKQYPGAACTNIMIIPSAKLGGGAGFTEPTEIMRQKELKLLVGNARRFFDEIRSMDLQSLSEAKIQELIETHHLTPTDLVEKYSTNYH